MFTGIIEEVGVVKGIARTGTGALLKIKAEKAKIIIAMRKVTVHSF